MTRAVTKEPPRLAYTPKFRVFIKSKDSVPIHEMILNANQSGVCIASNKEIDALFNDLWGSQGSLGNEYGVIDSLGPAFPACTGTLCAFVKPGETFRQKARRIVSLDNEHYLVYTDIFTYDRWIFHVKEAYLDLKDTVIVCEHPNFWFTVEGKDRIIKPIESDIVKDFPSEDYGGAYFVDPKYRIPQGKRIMRRESSVKSCWPQQQSLEYPLDAREFDVSRTYGEWVGFVNRDYYWGVVNKTRTICCRSPNDRSLGMIAVERPKPRFDLKGHPYRGSYSIVSML